jgi:YVTN family beta-propeller protein
VISYITLPATGYGVAYDPGNNLIYVAIPSLNEVVALDTGTGALEATISLGISEPEYLVYVPTDNYMWVTDRGSNSVTAINSSLNQDAGGKTVGSNPIGIAYDPVNKDVYTANYGSENITGINTISGITSTISVPGQKVEGVTYDPINNLLYSTDYYNMNTLSAGNTVSVINTTTDSVVGTITVGNNPVFAAYDPANEDVYVTNSGSDTVSVISSPSVSVSSSPSPIDAGQTATLTANPTSGSGSYTSYSWYVKPPGYSSFSIVPGVTTQTLSYATSGGSTPGTYYFEATVTDSNGVTSLLSLESGLTIYSDPTVSISPSGLITYNVGQTASQLTASVTYSGPNTASVEWYSNTVNSNSGGTDTGISGTYYTPSTSATGTLYYYAIVSDSGISGYSSPSGVVEVIVSQIHHQYQVKYLVNFGETGLPAGTTWYITIDGQTYSSNTQSISLTLPSGQNSYEVGGVAGYSPSPSYGIINVDYAPFEVEIVFSPNALNGYLTGSIPSTFSLFINGVQYSTLHGQFNITLKPGNYTINVKYSGKSEYYSNVTIHPSESTALDIGTLQTSSNPIPSIPFYLTVLTFLLLVSLVSLEAVVVFKLIRLRK